MSENNRSNENSTTVLLKKSTPNPAIVSLASTVDELEKHFKAYEEVKVKLLTESDYVQIKDKKAIAKSGWMKLGVAFNLSTEITRQERNEKDGKIRWEIDIRCIAPNGRYVDECGLCDNSEEKQVGSPEHKLKSMAVTRATERAYIKMLGAPDTAADDMPDSMKRDDIKPNNPNNQEVCHCPWSDIKNEDGTCTTCGKPLTVGQINTLYEMKKN